jgi:hypothetical protein
MQDAATGEFVGSVRGFCCARHLTYVGERKGQTSNMNILLYVQLYAAVSFLPNSTTARGGPWPPLQYASMLLDSLLCPSTC